MKKTSTQVKKKSKKGLIITLSVISAVLLIAVIAAVIYLNVYYKADETAVETFMEGGIQGIEIEDGVFAFEPEEPVAGMIFYPGGKVDARSYFPLMQACAENGILAIIVEMPYRLAVFDVNAADGIKELYPEVEGWYIGGHSLGGSMAASYLSEHKAEFDGIILLASYSTEDLASGRLKALSIYGSNDGVLSLDKYQSNRENLPTNTLEYIISGGNHAGFGMYGEQSKDGASTLEVGEQIQITADQILNFVRED